MEIWRRVRGSLPPLPFRKGREEPELEPEPAESGTDTSGEDVPDDALSGVRESLHALLDDEKVPAAVRRELAAEYRSLEDMLEKLDHGHIHIAVFGQVSVGKSSLLNALLGEQRFHTSALHGATRTAERSAWQTLDDGHVILYDTPGINEIDGSTREALAHEVAGRADLVLFVVDGDMTDSEIEALRRILQENRALLLVLNKADRYTRSELDQLLQQLREHAHGLVAPENIVTASAAPAERIYVEVDASGQETEVRRAPPPDVEALRERLWEILENEGKTLAAINAGLFAGRLSDQIAERVTEVKRELAQAVIRKYCLAKGLAVAFNPVPVTDLVAAAGLDAAMIVHLSRVYGLPMGTRESTKLVTAILAQLVSLMGAVWAINLVSSALKLGSAGLSTLLTASAQGAVAYYATLVVGNAAEFYLRHGKSWGRDGAKRAVRKVLNGIDRNSVLKEAREDIAQRLSRQA